MKLGYHVHFPQRWCGAARQVGGNAAGVPSASAPTRGAITRADVRYSHTTATVNIRRAGRCDALAPYRCLRCPCVGNYVFAQRRIFSQLQQTDASPQAFQRSAQSPKQQPTPSASPSPIASDLSDDDPAKALLDDVVAAIPFAPQTLKVAALYRIVTSQPDLPLPATPTTPRLPQQRSGSGSSPAVMPATRAAARRQAVSRRQVIRDRYRTMRQLVLHLAHESRHERWGVFLSCDCLVVARARDEAEAGDAFRALYTIDSGRRGSAPAADAAPSRADRRLAALPPAAEYTASDYCFPIEPEGGRSGAADAVAAAAAAASSSSFAETRERRMAIAATLLLRDSILSDSLLETYMPTFGADGTGEFTPPPPPPPLPSSAESTAADDRAESTTRLGRGGGGGGRVAASSNTFTPQMLVPMLPTFFVPLGELLAQLPQGYTAEHVRRIFGATGTIDLVTLPCPPDSSLAPHTTTDACHDDGSGNGWGTVAFARLHGGCSRVDFDISAATDGDDASATSSAAIAVHRHFAPVYAPDPFLADAFAGALAAAGEWCRLFDVVGPAPPHIQRALSPMDGPLSLLWFSQMQHRFHFAADNGGFVRVATGTTSLREETTPTPAAVAEVVGVLDHLGGAVFVDDIVRANGISDDDSGCRGAAPESPYRLSDFTVRQIILFFGTFRRFLVAHGDIFLCEEAAGASTTASVGGDGATADTPAEGVDVEGGRPRRGGGFAAPPRQHPMEGDGPVAGGSGAAAVLSPSLTVRLASSRHRENASATASPSSRTTLTTEERLEKALRRNDRRAARKARRRLAIERAPDTPYADPQYFLDAVLRYLPTRRPVSLRYFVKSLPPSLADFLPEVPLQMFRNAGPGKVQVFEWRRRNHLYLLRPGLPLPDGTLRSNYTEQELLYMIVEELHRRGSRTRHGAATAAATTTTRGESLSSLLSALPFGARLCVGNSVKQLLQFLQRHPQLFLIVFTDAVRMDVRAAKVSLLVQQQLPVPAGLRPEEWDAWGHPPTAAEVEEMTALDKAAMEEEHPGGA